MLDLWDGPLWGRAFPFSGRDRSLQGRLWHPNDELTGICPSCSSSLLSWTSAFGQGDVCDKAVHELLFFCPCWVLQRGTAASLALPRMNHQQWQGVGQPQALCSECLCSECQKSSVLTTSLLWGSQREGRGGWKKQRSCSQPPALCWPPKGAQNCRAGAAEPQSSTRRRFFGRGGGQDNRQGPGYGCSAGRSSFRS